MAYTELVVAEGVARRMAGTMIYLADSPQDHPVGAHLYGNDPDSFVRAAAVIEELGRFSLIDVNAGCPVRKITRKGAGAALLRDPQSIFRIVAGLKRATALPVTVKTRIGRFPGDASGMDAVCAAVDAGADAVCVHGRYASDHHAGPAHWDQLAAIKARVPVPVIGNGGADSVRDAQVMLRETGVDAVMIGRAALGNPWLFSELRALSQGQAWKPPSPAEVRDLILDHARRTVEMVVRDAVRTGRERLSPERAGCLLFRAHLLKYLAGRPGLRAYLRGHHDRLDSLEGIAGAVALFVPDGR